jgi:hypothetical protein
MADGRLKAEVPPPPQLPTILSEQAQSLIPRTLPSSPFTLGQNSYCSQIIFSKVTYVQNAELATVADVVEFLQHRLLYEMNKLHELNLIST